MLIITTPVNTLVTGSYKSHYMNLSIYDTHNPIRPEGWGMKRVLAGKALLIAIHKWQPYNTNAEIT